MAIASILELDSVREGLAAIENLNVKILGSAAIVLFLTYVLMTHDAIHPGFELIGMNPRSLTYIKAKIKFLTQGRVLMFEGLRKYNGRPFQLISLAGPELVFPTKYAKFIGADKRFSINGFIEREFFPSYPGFDGPKASLSSTVIQDSVRIKLTQSLGLVTKDLCEEADASLKDIFGENEEWSECYFSKICPDLVARLSTRVFLGPVLARNKEWLEIAEEYTVNMVIASRALRQCPAVLRPILHRLIPHCRAVARQSKQARVIIEGEIARRRATWEEARAKGIPVSKIADSLGWMQELAGDKPFDIAGGQLGLTFAAIHTTSDLLVKAMCRAAANQEYIEALRAEMIQVLSEDGWKKTALYKMKLLDSFLKEVQRLEPPSITSMHRVAEANVKLNDGTVIPKGASIKVIMDGHYDPELYPDPEQFDPYRYLKLRNQPGQENNWQFVSTSSEALGWGLGRHACPGRFFASNESKVALCWLLMRYDWKLVGEPKSMCIGTEMIADPSTKLAYRRRKEELDLSAI